LLARLQSLHYSELDQHVQKSYRPEESRDKTEGISPVQEGTRED
jgi:hypothetical protein